MKIHRIPIISLVLLVMAILVMFHQYYYWRTWFELKDIHHELFIVTFIFAAIILIIYANRKMKVIKVKSP